jgi:hypothetical protein
MGFNDNSVTISGGTITAAIDTSTLAQKTQLPTTLGVQAAGSSTSIALSTEDAAKVPSKGTAAMAASTPVTIATDDTVFTTLTNKFPTAAIPADGDANTGAPATVSRIAARQWVFNGTTWDAARSGITTIMTNVSGSSNTFPVGKYNATQPTLADTNAVVLQTDSRGNLRTVSMSAPQAQDDLNQVLAVQIRTPTTNAYTPSVFLNNAANNTFNVKGTPGVVVSFTCYNTTASSRFLLLHNTTSTPVNTNIPVVGFLVPAGGQIVIGKDFFTESGVYFALGIAFAISTTLGTLTLATSTDQITQVLYF